RKTATAYRMSVLRILSVTQATPPTPAASTKRVRPRRIRNFRTYTSLWNRETSERRVTTALQARNPSDRRPIPQYRSCLTGRLGECAQKGDVQEFRRDPTVIRKGPRRLHAEEAKCRCRRREQEQDDGHDGGTAPLGIGVVAGPHVEADGADH